MMLPSHGGTQPLSPVPVVPVAEGDLLGGRYRIEGFIEPRGLHTARATGFSFDAIDRTSGSPVTGYVLVCTPGATSAAVDHVARVANAMVAGARQARSLTSPHTVRVLDAGLTADGHPWVVTAPVSTTTILTHLRQRGPVPVAGAVDIALAVCDALAEAHSQGIVHGSLGPHAVHVGWSAGALDVKVTGIGTASAEAKLALGGARGAGGNLRAPEQLRDGLREDGRTDVWSIGVLLYTMLAGTPPFSADTPSGASLSVLLDEPLPLVGIEPALARVIGRAIAREPSQRPSSVLALAYALVQFSSNPEAARARIASRPPPAIRALHVESDPTLVVHRAPVHVSSIPPAAARRPSRIESSIPPAIHALEAPAVRIPRAPRLPTRTAIPAATFTDAPGSRDLPTVITKRPDLSFPRRRMLKHLGYVTAVASVALLVLLGTEGGRLAHRAATRPPDAQAATSLPPPATTAIPAPPSTDAPPPASSASALPPASSTTPPSPKRF